MLLTKVSNLFAPVIVVGGGTTWDPANKGAPITLSNGNLTAASSSNANSANVRSTTSKSTGKFYVEITVNSGSTVGYEMLGICNGGFTIGGTLFLGNDAFSLASSSDGNMYTAISGAGSGTTGISTYTTGDVIGIAIDVTSKLMWWRKNGGSFYGGVLVGDPTTGSNGNNFAGISGGVPVFVAAQLGNTHQLTVNFGDTAYATAAPSGYGVW